MRTARRVSVSDWQQAPINRFRNTSFVIDKTRSHFDRAYYEEVMGLHGRSLEGRRVLINRQNGHEAEIVDFVRCSYLGLDNHPAIIAGAIEAIQHYGALHWSCARTRLNYRLL